MIPHELKLSFVVENIESACFFGSFQCEAQYPTEEEIENEIETKKNLSECIRAKSISRQKRKSI